MTSEGDQKQFALKFVAAKVKFVRAEGKRGNHKKRIMSSLMLRKGSASDSRNRGLSFCRGMKNTDKREDEFLKSHTVRRRNHCWRSRGVGHCTLRGREGCKGFMRPYVFPVFAEWGPSPRQTAF